MLFFYDCVRFLLLLGEVSEMKILILTLLLTSCTFVCGGKSGGGNVGYQCEHEGVDYE